MILATTCIPVNPRGGLRILPRPERPLDDSMLHFMATCVSLETVNTETLRQVPHVQPTLQNCPLVDDEDFLAGTIDISVVPLELYLKAEFKQTELPFALRPTEYHSENNGRSL